MVALKYNQSQIKIISKKMLQSEKFGKLSKINFIKYRSENHFSIKFLSVPRVHISYPLLPGIYPGIPPRISAALHLPNDLPILISIYRGSNVASNSPAKTHVITK